MNILITGATGFIGTHLVERLVKRGHRVRALASPKSSSERLKFLQNLNAEIVVGDLAKPDSLAGVGEDMEILFHLGSISGSKSRKHYSEVNEQGTLALLRAFSHHPQKIILMSSVLAVGPCRGTPVNEKTECNPVGDYGASKLAQERIALQFCREKEIPLVILRPSPVYGPRNPTILKLLKALNARFFPIRSKNPCMDYIYVENLVDASLLVMEKGSGIYHVSDGRKYSLDDILNTITTIQGKHLLPIYFPKSLVKAAHRMLEVFSRPFKFQPPFNQGGLQWMTQKYWYSDISRIEALGYKGSIDLAEGMKRTINYFKEQGA